MLAVNDAYRLLPWAEVLYACDAAWWDVQYAHGPYIQSIQSFAGERWSSHDKARNQKLAHAQRYRLRLVAGREAEGFSFDPSVIHYGGNSGYQALNLALLMGAKRVILVGFDMRMVNGQRHFFGKHPAKLRNVGNYQHFIAKFAKAARRLPKGVEIINATPGSALNCFPYQRLEELCIA